MTSRVIVAVVVAVVLGACAKTPVEETSSPQAAVKYGENAAAGNTFEHDGVKLYYEVYGEGEPLLMIHGNGASIGALKNQIEYFRKKYKVVAMDSRDHGRSADSPDKITYEKMAGDQSALIDHLKLGPVNVLGWSDGGIEALLLGIHHPEQVKKIVSMAANLEPDGLPKEVLEMIKKMAAEAPNARSRKVTEMMLAEPHIPLTDLEKIQAPTLVLASDHDLIRDEHTIDIYHHLPNGALNIFPEATHMIPVDDPALFNATVERFLEAPFVKKDRIGDVMKSMEKVEAGK